MAGKHRRVSREAVRQNALKGASGNSWFALPEGVRQWRPEKADRYLINILPYEVKTDSHPDDIAKGDLWYKFPFDVHHGIGASNESVVCPRTIGKKCPICEERDRLYKEDPDKNEDTLKALRAQRFVAYNIVDPDDAEKVAAFIYSRGKFAVCLENELKDAENDEHLAFFDINEDGRTLKVRFSDEEFMDKKYLEASKIDFRPREAMDEEEVLAKVVCFEEVLQVLPHDKLKALFLQEETEEDEAEEDEEQEEAPAKPAAKPKPKPQPEPEEDEEPAEEDAEEEAEAEDEEPAPKPQPKKPAAKPAPAEDDEEPELPLDEEDEEPAPKPASKAPVKPKAPVADDDDDEDVPPPPAKPKCKACNGTGKNSKGGKCLPCAGTGKVRPANLAEPDEDDGEETPPAKPTAKAPAKPVSGAKKCPAGGTFGKDVDKHDQCDDCPHWEACEAASEA